MKSQPTSRFSVTVQAAWEDEDDSPAELFDGAYRVRLNHEVPVSFVPEFPRTPEGWPAIDVPDGYDGPTEVPEARAWVALQSRYVVTPTERPTAPVRLVDEEISKSLFFVTPDDYATIATELERLAERATRTGWPMSEVADLRVVRLLVDEVIPSDAFDADDRYWLTDPPGVG